MEDNTAPAVESADYPGCYYRIVGGELEWINPPMVIGTLYKTTERYMGKPVVTKIIDCGITTATTVCNGGVS